MPDAESKVTVLLVDDHAIVRKGIAGYLDLCDDLSIVAEASSDENTDTFP